MVVTYLRDALRRLPVGRGGSGRRNGVILADTGVTALTGVVLLVGAARSLSPDGLTTFALAQLVVVTAVGLLRAGVFGPAMAAQRTTGPASIPLRWGVTITQPAAVVVSGIVVLVVPGPGSVLWPVSVLVAAVVSLSQDTVRNVLLSRNRPLAVLLADVSTAVLVAAAVAAQRFPDSPTSLMLFWGQRELRGYSTTPGRPGAGGGRRARGSPCRRRGDSADGEPSTQP